MSDERKETEAPLKEKAVGKVHFPKRKKKEREPLPPKEFTALLLGVVALVLALLGIACLMWVETFVGAIVGGVGVLCGFVSLLVGKKGALPAVVAIVAGFLTVLSAIVTIKMQS